MTRKEFITVIKATWHEYGKDDVGTMAAALTYFAFFSLFPILILGFTTMSYFLGEEEARRLIYESIGRLLPGASELLTDALEVALSNRGASAGLIALIGAGALLWSALGAFDALDKAINRAWKTENYPNLFISKLIGLAMMLVMSIIIVGSLIITAALAAGRNAATDLFGRVPGEDVVWQIVNFFATIAIIYIVFVLMYRLLPRVDVTYRDVWLGALLAAIIWAVVKEGFAYFLGSNFANFDAVYGTLGAVVALLTWIYISSLIIITGAEFTAETARVRRLRVMAALGQAEAEGEAKKGSPWLSER
jgi:membrane protein